MPPKTNLGDEFKRLKESNLTLQRDIKETKDTLKANEDRDAKRSQEIEEDIELLMLRQNDFSERLTRLEELVDENFTTLARTIAQGVSGLQNRVSDLEAESASHNIPSTSRLRTRVLASAQKGAPLSFDSFRPPGPPTVLAASGRWVPRHSIHAPLPVPEEIDVPWVPSRSLLKRAMDHAASTEDSSDSTSLLSTHYYKGKESSSDSYQPSREGSRVSMEQEEDAIIEEEEDMMGASSSSPSGLTEEREQEQEGASSPTEENSTEGEYRNTSGSSQEGSSSP